MKIYTKHGDKGLTSLLGGTKVFKNDIRVEAYGTVDELNSYIGLLKNLNYMDLYNETLSKIQNKLFIVQALLAKDNNPCELEKLSDDDVLSLENQIDELSKNLSPLNSFIVPGENLNSAYVHIARTVCRRAERQVVALSQKVAIDDIILKFLNRLSDYLFTLARVVAKINK
jgi:cob(I)alamin adenosyltransferase